MIHAVLLTPNLTLGGAERWVVSLVKHALPSKLRWTGVVVSGWGGAERGLCEELAKLAPLHCNFVPHTERQHRRSFDFSGFSGIHATFSEAVCHASYGADVAVAWGFSDLSSGFPQSQIPIVLTSHTTERENGSYAVRGATHLAAVSEAAVRFFEGKNDNGLPVTVIYNGAEVDRCRPRHGRAVQRREWGVVETDLVVGYIGRQSREKNPRAAIDAVAELPCHFKAVYHGEPVSRPGDADLNLPGYAAERAPGRVIFRPPERDVGDILAGLDVFMLASHREAFSLALIEAWIAGVPVVATPVGSLPELQARYGKLVIEVPVNPTSEELAEAVALATSPEGRRIAGFAQRLALEHFTCEKMLERWTGYLEQICAKWDQSGQKQTRQPT